MSRYSDPPSPDGPVPPPYEPSQQEFDQKLALAMERSLNIAPPRSRNGDSQWEAWNQPGFQTAPAAHIQSSATGTPQNRPSYPFDKPAYPGNETTPPMRRHPSASAPMTSGSNPPSSQRPLPRPPPVPPIATAPTKERPSWFHEAQLGESQAGPTAAPQAFQTPSSAASSASPPSGGAQLRRRVTMLDGGQLEDDFEAPPAFSASPGQDVPAYHPASHPTRPRRVDPLHRSYNSNSPPPSPLVSPVSTNFSEGRHELRTPPPLPPPSNGSMDPSFRDRPSTATHRPHPMPHLQRPFKQVPNIRPPTVYFNPEMAYGDEKAQQPEPANPPSHPAASLYSSAISAHIAPKLPSQPIRPATMYQQPMPEPGPVPPRPYQNQVPPPPPRPPSLYPTTTHVPQRPPAVPNNQYAPQYGYGGGSVPQNFNYYAIPPPPQIPSRPQGPWRR